MKKYNLGLTIVELLVVMAIIAILSSILLVSLGSTRQKSNDAAIQQNLVNLRTQIALYQSKNGNYGVDTNSCSSGIFADPDIAIIITEVEKYNGAGVATCFADDGSSGDGSAATSYAVSSPLSGVTPGVGSWCVDSSGASVAKTANLSSNIASCQ